MDGPVSLGVQVALVRLSGYEGEGEGDEEEEEEGDSLNRYGSYKLECLNAWPNREWHY
jgi:hypothetical protein